MFLCTSISILIFQYSILNGKIPPAPPPHRKCESSKVTLRKSGSGKNAHLRSLRKKSKISQAQYGQQRPTNVWYAEDFICNSHKKNYSSKDPLYQAKGQFEELLSKHSAVPQLSLAFLMFREPPKTWFFLLHVYHPPTLSSPHSPSLSLDFSLMILGVNSKMLVAIKDLFLQTKG